MPIRRRKTRKLGRPRRVGRPKTVGNRRTRTRRVVRRGGSWLGDKFKSAWNWGKSKISDLWNNNKGMLKAKAMSLANQAKERALQEANRIASNARDSALRYAREKKILSSTVNKILPSRYGIDKIASAYVSNKTGMGRRRRRTVRGRGFGNFMSGLWGGVKRVGGTVANIAMPIVKKAVMPVVEKAIVPMLSQVASHALVGGGRKRRTRRKTGRGLLSSLISARKAVHGKGLFGASSLGDDAGNFLAKNTSGLIRKLYGGGKRKRTRRTVRKGTGKRRTRRTIRGKGIIGGTLGGLLFPF